MPTPDETAAAYAAAADKAAADKAAADKAASDKAAADKAAADKAAVDKAAADDADKRYKDPDFAKRMERERNAAELKLRETATAAAEAQKKLDAIEKAKLEQSGEYKTLAEKAQAELDKANAAHTKELAARDERFVAAEIRSAATIAGMRDPNDANLFLDKTGIKVDADRVEGVEAALAKLKIERPYLFKVDEGDTGDKGKRRPLAPAATSAKTTHKDAKDMTPEEFSAAGKSFGWDKA